MLGTANLISLVHQDAAKIRAAFPTAPWAVCLFLSQMPGLLPTIKNFSYSMLLVKPLPFLEDIYEKLVILKENTSLDALSPKEKEKLAGDLVSLVTDRETLLQGLTEGDGTSAELSTAQKQEIAQLAETLTTLSEEQQNSLLFDLVDDLIPTSSSWFGAFYSSEENSTTSTTSPEPLHILSLIRNVHATISHFRDLQLGLIPTAIEYLRKTVTLDNVKELCGLIPNPDQPDVAGMRKQNRELQREIRNRSRPIEPKLESTKENLDVKMQRLQQLGEQLLMTKLLFGDRKDMGQVFQDILNATTATHNSNLDADVETIFQHSLAGEFKKYYPSWKDSIYLGFCLSVVFPLMRFYLHYALGKAREDLSQFLALSPEQKMDLIFRLLVDPLSDHLTQFTSDQTASVSNKLPHQLSFYLVDKYIPSLASVHLDTRLEKQLERLKGTLLDPAIPLLKAVSQAVSFIPDTLIFLVDTFVHKELIRQVLARVGLPKLLNPAYVNLGTTSPYQHALNQVFLEQLYQLGSSTKKSKPKAVKASFQQQEKLAGTIVRLSRAIALRDTLVSGKISNERLDALLAEGANFAAPTIASQILQALESSLESDSLASSLKKVLDNIVTTLQSPSSAPNGDEMRAVEEELLQVLKDTADVGVEELAQALLDPTKKLQEELTSKIEELKQRAAIFAQTQAVEDVENEWKSFSLAVNKLATDLKNKQIPSLLAFSNHLLADFTSKTAKLNELLGDLRPSQQDIKRIEQTRDNLSRRLDFFNIQDLTVQQILQALTTLKSQSGQDEKDPALQTATLIFTLHAENYSKLMRPQDSKTVFEKQFSTFKDALQASMQRFEQTIKDKQAELQVQTVSLHNKLSKLPLWAKALSAPTITPEEVASPLQMVINKLAPILQTPLVNQITAYGTSAYSMTSNPYHSHQMIQRVAEAFLKL